LEDYKTLFLLVKIFVAFFLKSFISTSTRYINWFAFPLIEGFVPEHGNDNLCWHAGVAPRRFPVTIHNSFSVPNLSLPVWHILEKFGQARERRALRMIHGVGEVILFLLFVSCVFFSAFLLGRGH
jgi:hypothetical protein